MDSTVKVSDVMRLMQDYLDGRINVGGYQKSLFQLFKRRMDVPSADADRILQRAYGDADDYDATIRLAYTIEEAELKERVARSIAELESLGYK